LMARDVIRGRVHTCSSPSVKVTAPHPGNSYSRIDVNSVTIDALLAPVVHSGSVIIEVGKTVDILKTAPQEFRQRLQRETLRLDQIFIPHALELQITVVEFLKETEIRNRVARGLPQSAVPAIHV